MDVLQKENIDARLKFIEDYAKASNPADGSEVDANANVTHKTIATLQSEMYKPYTVQINRARVVKKLREMFPDEPLDKAYICDLENHLIYTHDESSLNPYCASITLYPYLLKGTKCLGGVSSAPKNIYSFSGSCPNLIYQVSSNFAGATSTPEFLMYFDYFARLTWGQDYLAVKIKETFQCFQECVYGLNEPSNARGSQSVFWNIALFDKAFMEEMFGEFYFPDGTQPDFESVTKLQKVFFTWLGEERKKEMLTFPVVTASLLTAEGKVVDKDLEDYLAEEFAKGNTCFIYMSNSVDSLSSCCRLRNELADNTFSYTLGAGGVATGSSQVITLNLNRFVQTGDGTLRQITKRVQKYLLAHRAIYKDYINKGLLPVYSAGFIDLDKQFLTIGINGLVEAIASKGLKVGNNHDYKDMVSSFFATISKQNKRALLKYGVRFNTEIVPAENLGVKNAKWDKQDNLIVPRNVYNSYLYPVEDESLTILDRIMMHSKDTTENLDGGSALHLNLQQVLSKEQYKALFSLTAKYGVPYWTVNVKCTGCKDCGYINPFFKQQCTDCGSQNVRYGTRIIGYLKWIENYAEARRTEESQRFYGGMEVENG